MLFNETISCVILIFLFAETSSRQSLVSNAQEISESGSISIRTPSDNYNESFSTVTNHAKNSQTMRSLEEYNELSSTQTNKPKHSQTASPTRYDPKETVSNDMRIECSQVHTFPVKLLYRSNKTVSSCFRYVLLREDFCQKKYPEIFVIAIVHTGLRNFKRRSLIRKTWANSEFYKKFKLAVVFAVGEDPQHPSVQATLQREWETYEDIVQFNFTDTYHNLSLKAISWLNWAAKYCPNAKYILKVDDDVNVNTFGIMRFFRKRKALDSSPKAFYCFVWREARVRRSSNDKWYVSYEEFNETVYPTFCSGRSYSLTMQAVQPLLDSVELTPFLWLDDVYITGLLAKTANVEHIEINSMYYESYDEGKKTFLDNPIVFVHLPRSLNKQYALWKKTLQLCKVKDCYN